MNTRTTLLTGAAFTGVIAACGSGGGGDGSAPSSTTSAALDVASVASSTRGVIPRLPPKPTRSVSTVPPNGDLNPYGIAFVPREFPRGGVLRRGDILVENFNAASNLQGTGTTILRLGAKASPSVFFQDASAPGFSTALGVLRGGFVLQGTVPSADGSGACTGAENNVGEGALLVIDRRGKLVRALTSAALLDGPWDLALSDHGSYASAFVSNVKRGTVTRLDLRVDVDGDGDDGVIVERATQIASGYAHRCDPAAFVVGPTGLALDRERDLLYVASTADNAIFAVSDASSIDRDRGTGRAVVRDATHLHGPVGLVRTRDGDLISAQGDAVNADPEHPSELVEFTRDGRFVAELSVDSAPGSAFGVALEEGPDGLRFAAVDDGQNVLDVWDVR